MYIFGLIVLDVLGLTLGFSTVYTHDEVGDIESLSKS